MSAHRGGPHKVRTPRLKPEDTLSQMEAAAFLGTSRMQVNRWVRAGHIRDRKILGTSRIEVRELLFFSRKRGLGLASRVCLLADTQHSREVR